MPKTDLLEREKEFLELAIKERKHDLLVEREARVQLAAETWEAPPVEEWSSLEDTDPDYLIDGIIEVGTVGTLIGKYGTGKSFLAIDWGACVAMAKPWQGHEVPAKANVLYVAAEGGPGMGRRRKAWEIEHNLKMESGGMFFLRRPIPLAAEEAVLFLERLINQYDIGFLVVDTLARSIPGLNENDAVDMGKVIETLYRLRDSREEPTTVLVLHHHGKNTSLGARGSSRLTSDVDFCYEIQENKEAMTGECFILSASKVKDGERPPNFAYRLKQVEWHRDQKDVSSCVIEADFSLPGQTGSSDTTLTDLGYCRLKDEDSNQSCFRKVEEGHWYCRDHECRWDDCSRRRYKDPAKRSTGQYCWIHKKDANANRQARFRSAI